MKKSTAILAAAIMLGSTAFAGNHSVNHHRFLPLSNFELFEDTSKDTGQTQVEYTTLPANIQYAVKEQYPNFQPTKMATKIEAEGQTIYMVTVESETRIISLRCGTDGEIQMQSSGKKTN